VRATSNASAAATILIVLDPIIIRELYNSGAAPSIPDLRLGDYQLYAVSHPFHGLSIVSEYPALKVLGYSQDVRYADSLKPSF